jgi:hypothetical protein
MGSLIIRHLNSDVPAEPVLGQLFQALRESCSPDMFASLRLDQWDVTEDAV